MSPLICQNSVELFLNQKFSTWELSKVKIALGTSINGLQGDFTSSSLRSPKTQSFDKTNRQDNGKNYSLIKLNTGCITSNLHITFFRQSQATIQWIFLQLLFCVLRPLFTFGKNTSISVFPTLATASINREAKLHFATLSNEFEADSLRKTNADCYLLQRKKTETNFSTPNQLRSIRSKKMPFQERDSKHPDWNKTK